MNYFEISKRNSKGGRRKIKMALLEIHQNDTDTNKNGLHWKEEYIINNLESAKEMPICCEFLDEDKSTPLGHGMTGIDASENQPLFEDSECVGCIETAYPTTVEINGIPTRILCGEGYIFQQRYPKFVEWLKDSMQKGKVMSSIEIMGNPENDNQIIYENNEYSQDFRTPKEFSFSGTAILSIEPADDSALILQMNSLNFHSNNKNNKNNEREEKKMDEKTLGMIVDSVKNTIVEVNSKNAEYESQISALNSTVDSKDAQIVELNASIENLQKALADMKAEQETWWTERELIEKQLAEMKVAKRLSELNTALADFTDEQKDYAKTEIEAFNADPMSVEINTITDKIYTEMGKKSMADAKAQKASEINSKNEDPVDIYGEVCSTTTKENDDISIY